MIVSALGPSPFICSADWKIAQGRMNKWYKEVTLVNQAFIKDNKSTVAQYVNSSVAGATVTGFRRASLD